MKVEVNRKPWLNCLLACQQIVREPAVRDKENMEVK